jgi:hypothetical protein
VYGCSLAPRHRGRGRCMGCLRCRDLSAADCRTGIYARRRAAKPETMVPDVAREVRMPYEPQASSTRVATVGGSHRPPRPSACVTSILRAMISVNTGRRRPVSRVLLRRNFVRVGRVVVVIDDDAGSGWHSVGHQQNHGCRARTNARRWSGSARRRISARGLGGESWWSARKVTTVCGTAVSRGSWWSTVHRLGARLRRHEL